MDNQKIEPVLNLALDTSEEERRKSEELQTGYDEVEKTWELIVRYSGDIEYLRILNINIVYLLNNYAILTVPENLVNNIAGYEEIIYVEKPKRVYFEVIQGIRASCINTVQADEWGVGERGLFGENVICAIIDSGIDYNHPVFKKPDGTTRIIRLWDQSIRDGNPPEGYSIGTLYTEEDINEALSKNNLNDMYDIVPSRDLSGHGTHVAGIMAGNFANDRNKNVGIATKSEIMAVKLGNPVSDDFPRTSEIMQAVNYIVTEAERLNKPVAINLSFGNSYGSHDGTSLIETFIDTAMDNGRTVMCVGSGNEGASGGHTGGNLRNDREEQIEFGVGEFQTSFSIQIWKIYADDFVIEISSPGINSNIRLQNKIGPQRYILENTILMIYYGEPSPYSRFQEIYIDFIPQNNYITPGIWNIILSPIKIVDGRYDMWLPVNSALNEQTRFLRPQADTTLTIPSTSDNVITVGAYDNTTFSVADFSGRGYTRFFNLIKPDIVAPGVNILSAAPGGGTSYRSGTSMACPFASGGAALMMEWGIVRKNDEFLYGEKVKAYMIKGARALPGQEVPSKAAGWGALCIRDSIPE